MPTIGMEMGLQRSALPCIDALGYRHRTGTTSFEIGMALGTTMRHERLAARPADLLWSGSELRRDAYLAQLDGQPRHAIKNLKHETA